MTPVGIIRPKISTTDCTDNTDEMMIVHERLHSVERVGNLRGNLPDQLFSINCGSVRWGVRMAIIRSYNVCCQGQRPRLQ
jgi:hypothetical protein